MTTLIAIGFCALVLGWAGIKLIAMIWDSPLFWIAMIALTVVLFPLTAGLSPAGLTALVILRFVLLARALSAGRVS